MLVHLQHVITPVILALLALSLFLNFAYQSSLFFRLKLECQSRFFGLLSLASLFFSLKTSVRAQSKVVHAHRTHLKHTVFMWRLSESCASRAHTWNGTVKQVFVPHMKKQHCCLVFLYNWINKQKMLPSLTAPKRGQVCSFDSSRHQLVIQVLWPIILRSKKIFRTPIIS